MYDEEENCKERKQNEKQKEIRMKRSCCRMCYDHIMDDRVLLLSLLLLHLISCHPISYLLTSSSSTLLYSASHYSTLCFSLSFYLSLLILSSYIFLSCYLTQVHVLKIK